jgi:hypothetical protein
MYASTVKRVQSISKLPNQVAAPRGSPLFSKQLDETTAAEYVAVLELDGKATHRVSPPQMTVTGLMVW